MFLSLIQKQIQKQIQAMDHCMNVLVFLAHLYIHKSVIKWSQFSSSQLLMLAALKTESHPHLVLFPLKKKKQV